MEKKTPEEIADAILARDGANLASHFPRIMEEEIQAAGYTKPEEVAEVRLKVVMKTREKRVKRLRRAS